MHFDALRLFDRAHDEPFECVAGWRARRPKRVRCGTKVQGLNDVALKQAVDDEERWNCHTTRLDRAGPRDVPTPAHIRTVLRPRRIGLDLPQLAPDDLIDGPRGRMLQNLLMEAVLKRTLRVESVGRHLTVPATWIDLEKGECARAAFRPVPASPLSQAQEYMPSQRHLLVGSYAFFQPAKYLLLDG